MTTDWKAFHEEKNVKLKELDDELSKLWDEGTAPISEYKRVTFAKRDLRKEYDRKWSELRRQDEKETITDMRKGSILLIKGYVINTEPELANKTCKLLRKGQKRATVRILEGNSKDKEIRMPYSYLIPLTDKNRKQNQVELESNKMLAKVF
jgi:hypothetical protein